MPIHFVEHVERFQLAAFAALLQPYWPPFWTYDRTKSSAFSSRTSSISSSNSSNSAFSFSPFSEPAGAVSSTSSSVRLGADLLICSRSAIAAHQLLTSPAAPAVRPGLNILPTTYRRAQRYL